MDRPIQKLYQIYLNAGPVVTDSRQVSPGSLFFALKGDTFDGNEFARQAIDKGAAYAVIDNREFAADRRYILVEDTLTTLQQLASYHREQLNIPVVGITGTNGKTTTKELVSLVLGQKYHTCATQGNLNNHIGVPLTLLSVNKEAEIAVVEMGANHRGEIEALCRIARPTCGLITNIGKAHLEGFGGFEGVVRAKNELYQYLAANHGLCFVNNDHKLLQDLSSGMRRISYGFGSESDIIGRLTASDPLVTLQWKSRNDPGYHTISTRLTGRYNAENLLAAVCVGTYFGVEPLRIGRALETYSPSNFRSQVITTGHNTVIMDAYNANPFSMEAAIMNFSALTLPYKVVILGDMYELGEESIPEHLRIMELAERQDFSMIIFVGETFSSLCLGKKHLHFADSGQARAWLQEHPPHNCSILVKGSRKVKLETILDTL